MNALNRIITTIILLVLLVVLVVVALSPSDAITWVQMGLSNLSSKVVGYQATEPTNFNIGRVALVIAAILLIVPLIRAEWPRKGESTVRLQTASGGAQVTTDSIARRLSWHLDQMADIISVQPQVRARGDQVDVLLDVETSPQIDVPMKTEEVMLTTREIVQDHMGLKLGRLDVRLRHSDYPRLA